MSALPHLDWDALDRVRCGEGTTEERAHLVGCAACRAELDEIARLAGALRRELGAAARSLPEHREEAVLEAARSRAAAIRSGRLVRLARWRRPAPLALAASLAVAVGAGYLTYHQRARPWSEPPTVSSAEQSLSAAPAIEPASGVAGRKEATAKEEASNSSGGARAGRALADGEGARERLDERKAVAEALGSELARRSAVPGSPPGAMPRESEAKKQALARPPRQQAHDERAPAALPATPPPPAPIDEASPAPAAGAAPAGVAAALEAARGSSPVDLEKRDELRESDALASARRRSVEVIYRLGAEVIRTLRETYDEAPRDAGQARYEPALAPGERAARLEMVEPERRGWPAPGGAARWRDLALPAGPITLEMVTEPRPLPRDAAGETSLVTPLPAAGSVSIRLVPEPGFEIRRAEAVSAAVEVRRLEAGGWRIVVQQGAEPLPAALTLRVAVEPVVR